jgi:lysine 2,3-aminomutase
MTYFPPAQTFSRQERLFRQQHFSGATAAEWNDWRWQLRHRRRTVGSLSRMLTLSSEEAAALSAPDSWRLPVALTPYALCLLAAAEPGSPLRKTLLPDLREAQGQAGEWRDPLGEESHQVAPGLIHSYPHKVLLLATNDCACFCRYCTRARTAGPRQPVSWSRALTYIRQHDTIQDVLISGGDPLTLGDVRLASLVQSLRAISHVRLIRIGTKVPAMLPQRVTPALVRMLKKAAPVWISVHFTHPAELTPRAAAACRRLLEAGIPLMNQTVLLRGVNDTLETMTALNEGLLQIGVKPYYLHQGDLAAGTAHLRSTVAKGRQILRGMQGQVSGYAIPHFMFDPPGGGGKIPLGPAEKFPSEFRSV